MRHITLLKNESWDLQRFVFKREKGLNIFRRVLHRSLYAAILGEGMGKGSKFRVAIVLFLMAIDRCRCIMIWNYCRLSGSRDTCAFSGRLLLDLTSP